jgi:uncharacterized repeat protein (TIGR01451 family)
MSRRPFEDPLACRRTSILVPPLAHHCRRAEDRRAPERGHAHRRPEEETRCRPLLESLEPRYLMAASLDWQQVLSSAGPCNCSICTGQNLNQLVESSTTSPAPSGTFAASNPLSSLPQLSSNPGATAKLFLDFNGHVQASWGNYTNAVTPVYDQDGDRTTFSSGELASITEIWARVAEDYAPFNIDVTTIAPGSLANGVVAHIAIGGNYSDWFGSSAGGVAYIGGFYNSAPNVGYVFEDALGNGNARYVAEAASHEAGHLFGLWHQSTWSGTTLQAEYSQGNAQWAPIMGVGYYSQRTTWHNGPNNLGSTSLQDDMAILANSSNGFGYRADDFGSTLALASALANSGGTVNFAGRIGSNTDQDWFEFTTGGGALNLSLNVAQFGANLDSVLELRDASGTILVTANPTNSLGATLTANLTSGTYYVVVRSSGGYGNVGTYTLTGTATAEGSGGGGGGGEETPEPEINVNVGTTVLQTGGTVAFGTVQIGNSVDRTITVRNSGPGTLNLQALVAENMPAGFTLVSNLSSLTLATNQTATFTVRFSPTVGGAVNQTISLLSDDADESAFQIKLTATAPQPEIAVSLGTVNVNTGGTIAFGNVSLGNFVNKTITIKNTGPGVLTLQALVPEDMPPGFTLVSNLSRLTLATNQTATFTVRFAPTVVGATAQSISLLSNDANESTFVLNLTGNATPAPQPEIAVSLGTVNVNTGGTINFGSIRVGTYVNKVITVKNTGPGVLNLQALVPGDMPPGFTLVTNLAKLSLAKGQSTTFTVRFTPSAVGAASESISILSNDADESAFTLNLSGTATPPPAPEIAINVGATNVESGGTVDFGNVPLTQYLNQVVTIKNTGNATLTLQKLLPANMPPGFTIVTNLAVTSLAAGKSTTFTLRYTPTAVGSVNETITLFSNDADEGSFQINLTATGTPAPVIRAIDNGAAGFSSTGTWSRVTYQGRENDLQTALKGNGSTTATWTFTNMPPGVYRVHANWTASTLYATNAPFTVYDGDTALSTVLVNQERASSGFTWGGTAWSSLGTFEITGDTVRVVLTNLANDRVVADAVRIERMGDLPEPEGISPANSPLASSLPTEFQPPVGSTTLSQSPAEVIFSSLAQFWAPSFLPGGDFMSSSSNLLSASTVDALFSIGSDTGESADVRAELELLQTTRDLVQTASSAVRTTASSARSDGGAEGSDKEFATYESLPANWLMDDQLDLILS